MSSVSEMQWKVNEQRRINHELHSELNAIAAGISAACGRWERLCESVAASLSSGAQRVNASQNYMNSAYDMQGDIDRLYVLFKNIETANKKIRECNYKKIYDYANYSAVRKIVTALLDNLETQFVSDGTIARAVEIKHLQTPDYWLTCALIAVMAWRSDDRELADQALRRACALDKKQTAVFFMAFNLRSGRESAALKWFDCYRSCELTGEDDRTFLMLFSIISRAARENCGDAVIGSVESFIGQIVSESMNGSGCTEEEAVSRILGYLRRMAEDEAIGYTMLMKYCTEGDYLTSQMMLAKANVNILGFVLNTVNVTDTQRRDYLNAFIEETVKKPNSAELENEDEILFNELIIRHRGNIEAAKAEFDRIRAHRDNDFDIITEMIDHVYRPSPEGEVSPMVRANMFAITRELSKKALRAYVQSYRARFKTRLNIRINDYEAAADLTDAETEKGRLRAFIEEKKAKLLSSVRRWPSFIGFGAAAAGIAGTVFLSPAFIAAAAAGAAFGAIYLLYGSSKRRRIARISDEEYRECEGILLALIGEFADYCREYAEYDSCAQKAEEEMTQ